MIAGASEIAIAVAVKTSLRLRAYCTRQAIISQFFSSSTQLASLQSCRDILTCDRHATASRLAEAEDVAFAYLRPANCCNIRPARKVKCDIICKSSCLALSIQPREERNRTKHAPQHGAYDLVLHKPCHPCNLLRSRGQPLMFRPSG